MKILYPDDSGDHSLDMGGLHGLLGAFVRAVESGTPPETSAADNINSLGIVFAAVESAETGEVARLDQSRRR